MKKQTKKTNILEKAVKRADTALDALDFIADCILDVNDDVTAIMERDPAATSKSEVLLLYSGLHAVMAHRVAHKINKKHPLAARAISQAAKFATGIEIHPGATIGRRLVIDHGTGIVIGETTEIGDDVLIYQGVTLGGTGKDVGKRHPTIGNRVMISAGSKVLGPITIGDDSRVAAGAVVLKDVPPNSTVVGVPARVVRQNGKKVEVQPLDQIHVPDPIQLELDNINKKLKQLEAQLKENP